MQRFCFAAILLCTIAPLTACSGLSAVNAGLPGSPSTLPPATRGTHARVLPSQLLFVPAENGSIDIYPLKDPTKSGIIAQITGLVGNQQAMTVDAGNDLFVVNNGPSASEDFVSEYAPPYASAPTILSTTWMSAIFYPVGIAVDSKGTVYVSNCGAYCSETPAVFVYPAGSTSPAQAITAPGFSSLAGLAIDTSDNLYAVNWNDSTDAVDVFKMKAGSTKPIALHLHGLVTGNGGNGVTLDAKGNLYVAANSSGSNYILEYKPGAHNALRAIKSLPFTVEPTMIDVGPDGDLYVPVTCVFTPCTEVYGFKAGAKKPFESIATSQYAGAILGVATAPNLQLQGSKR